jgi:peptidoglycan/LPS O-acetylase OafA/YrhL
MAKTRVNEIDLLRFLAALMVVLFHYAFRGYAADGYSPIPYPLLAPAAKYGYLGVQLFFMISGFVILMTADSGDLRKFVISRIVRLYPAFWASVTITFIAITILGGTLFQATISQYFINMTMLSEFVGVPPIDGVYWSIFVELKFYALVALILVIGKIHRAEQLLVLWLILTMIVDLYPNKFIRYFLITDYAMYFIAGATCFLAWSRGWSRLRITIILIAWLVALHQSLNTIPLFENKYNESINSFVVIGIISAFFLIVFLISIRKTEWFARRRWLVLGALTYPLYLIHQKLGYMLIGIAYPAMNPHVVLWGTLLVVLATSYAIYIFVEKRTAPLLKQLINSTLDTFVQGIESRLNRNRTPRR